MARSIDTQQSAVRGFVPAQNDEERFLMRHVEDLARAAFGRGIARYSAFLSDREQQLAQAALNRADAPEEQLPVHKDYLGSLMGLELRREALGDIVLPPEEPGTAYLFALEPAAALICQELRSVGRTEVTAQQLALDEVPEFAQAERRLQTATVSSLRLDAVLAAMLRCSRGMAAELVAAGRVEINHLPVSSAHAPVYESDVFTVRGKGRFRLTALPGKSKKDRQIIEFFQY